MRNLLIIKAIYILFVSHFAGASDTNSINATILYGEDTNPHNLASELTPLQQTFAEGEFKFRTNYNNTLFASGKAVKSVYFDDARADTFKASGRVSLKSDFKIFDRKFKYKFGLSHLKSDKTYVSKTTGQVATFGGASIADRYDSTQNNYLFELSYRPYRTLKVKFNYKTREKTYTEFEIDGLSNLDYSHINYLLGMEYKSSDLGRFFLEGSFRQREYLDRRAKDLDGDTILDTDLIYDYHIVNIGYIYRPDKKVRWKYTYNYEKRQDNSTGFYNTASGYISIIGKYQFGDYHFLKGRLKYSKVSYDNQLDPGDDSLLDEDAKEKQGGMAMIGYEWILATLFDTNIAFYIELEHSVFANTNLIYTYEKSKASAGIRWSAF